MKTFVSFAVLAALAMLASILSGPSVGLLLVAPPAIWITFRHYFNASFASPTTIAAGIFYFIGVLGFLLRGTLAESDGSGASISITLDDNVAFATLLLMMVFTSILLTTGGVLLLFAPRRSDILSNAVSWRVREPPITVVAVSSIPFFLMLFDVGVANVIQRNYYLVGEAGTILGGIGGPLATAAVMVVGYVFRSSRGPAKGLAIALLLAYVALLFSFGSRRFALVPILFALGAFLASNTKGTRRGVLAGALLSLALLPLPLAFRDLPSHGLVPYLEALGQLNPFNANWLSALNNVLVSFGIIAVTAFGSLRFDWGDLGMAVNPLPGESVGWYDNIDRFMLNPFTPVAGLGELGNVGWPAVVLFAVAIGAVLAWLEVVTRRQIALGAHIYAALLLGLTVLFSLQMVQYTLRSAMRLLLYQAVLEVGRRMLKVLRTSKQSGRSTTSAEDGQSS